MLQGSSEVGIATNERSEDLLAEESFVCEIRNFHSRSELECVRESKEAIPFERFVLSGELFPET